MTAVVTIALIVIGLGLAFLLAAQVEFSRQLADLRRANNISSQPRILPLKHLGEALSTAVLPAHPDLVGRRAELFFVNASCHTCEGIASLLVGSLPQTTWLVADGDHRVLDAGPLHSLSREAEGRVVRDDGGLADVLGVHATPTLVVLEDRVPMAGFVISTAQQFRDITSPYVTLDEVADMALPAPILEGVSS